MLKNSQRSLVSFSINIIEEKSVKVAESRDLLKVISMGVFCSIPLFEKAGVISVIFGRRMQTGRIRMSDASLRSLTVIL